MIETIPSLQQSQRQLHARMTSAVGCLARQQAIKAVKRPVQAEGRRKLRQIAHREIVTMAREYLATHPELIAEAKPIVEQWRREGFFGKKAARDAHNLRVTSKEERPAVQGLLLNETHAQNGAAK
jgi:hypothetical protein